HEGMQKAEARRTGVAGATFAVAPGDRALLLSYWIGAARVKPMQPAQRGGGVGITRDFALWRMLPLRSAGGRNLEHVAGTALGENEPRCVRLVLHLLAQARDVIVHGARRR